MPYPENLCAPMRQELSMVGFQELRTSEEVESFFADKTGSALILINSVCGCAAGSARPGVINAIQGTKRPDRLATVFAGQDLEATAQARKYMIPFPPSSPAIALFNNGELIHFVERHHIEGRSAEMVAEHLKSIFEEF